MKQLLIIAMLLGCLTAAYDITSVNYQARRMNLTEEWNTELMLHAKYMHGVTARHWQYRALPEYIIEMFSPMQHMQHTNENGKLDDAWDFHFSVISNIVLKVVTNVLLFVLFALYLGKLGIDNGKIFIGLFVAVLVHFIGATNNQWMHSYYMQLCFFLGFSLMVLTNKNKYWFLLLIVPAALTNETAVFIPLTMLSLAYYKRDKWQEYLLPGLALGIFLMIFYLLRTATPQQSASFAASFLPEMNSFNQMLVFNLSDVYTLSLLITFLAAGVWLYLQQRKTLHSYLAALVPVSVLWIGLNLYGGYAREIRTSEAIIYLLLIPMILSNTMNTSKGLIEKESR
jgi:hypothetical protein